MSLNLHTRISKLWAASFNLLTACEEACKHLPEEHRQELQTAVNKFIHVTNSLRNKKED